MIQQGKNPGAELLARIMGKPLLIKLFNGYQYRGHIYTVAVFFFTLILTNLKRLIIKNKYYTFLISMAQYAIGWLSNLVANMNTLCSTIHLLL